jgi:radical SAM protein with 4Fe4S-binding SPASM domain|tara:strand:+ start:7632 stop:8822 length:1191 start_codon:yes stop_codon:yes gene_type:complete
MTEKMKINITPLKKKGFKSENFTFVDFKTNKLHQECFDTLTKIKNDIDNQNLSNKEKIIINKIFKSYKKAFNSEELAEDEMILNNHELLEFKKINKKDFVRYLVYRYKYNKYSQLKILDEYPPCINIEPTSVCNYRCVMCYQADKTFSKKSSGFMGNMSFELFKKVIDEINGKIEAVTLASRGEPTLNKELDKMLKYCEKKFLALKLNTNASLLNEKNIHSLLSSDLQTIVFSIDEKNKENYEKIRINGKFEKILKNLELFNKIRDTKYNRSDKVVRISGVKINKNQNLDEMKAQWKDYADIVAFTNYQPWESSYDNPVNDIDRVCGELYNSMYVWWDGKVNPCDFDYKSTLSKWNAKDKSIKDIWNSEPYNFLRQKHINQQRSSIEPCKRCISTS